MNSTFKNWAIVVAIALIGIFLIPKLFERPDISYYGYVPHQSISLTEVHQSLVQADTAKRPIRKLVFLTDELSHPVGVVVSVKGGEEFLMRLPGEAYAAKLTEEAIQAGVNVDSQVHPHLKIDWDSMQKGNASSVIGMMLGILVPPVLMIVFMIWMNRRMQGMPGATGSRSQADQLGKSKARELTGEKVKTRFTDVAGCDEAKEEFQDLVRFLKNPEALKRMGGKIPKGVLLVGPPGVGKTLLAKAVAGEAGVTFFSTSGSEFVEMFVGVGAARIRDTVEQARAKKPCIIFLDELDALGKHRGTGIGGGNDEREQTLNQLLVMMDGLEEEEGVVFIGATNRPDVLDPALKRAGRFGDLTVTLSLPDRKGREEILAVHARGKLLAADVSCAEIAKRSSGFSGAQLASTLEQAAKFATRRTLKELDSLIEKGISAEEASASLVWSINMQDLDEGISAVQLGTSTTSQSRRLSDEVKKLLAVHELGHAIAAEYLYHMHGVNWNERWGDPVHKVTIIGVAGAGGYTLAHRDDDSFIETLESLKGRIVMTLAANRAEHKFLGTTTTGAANDFKQAYSIVQKMVTQWGMSSLGPISVGQDEEHPFLGKALGSVSSGGYGLGTESSNQIDREIKKLLDEGIQRADEILDNSREFMFKMIPVIIEKETLLREEWLRHFEDHFGSSRKSV